MSGDCWIPFANRTLHIKPSCNVDIDFEIQDLESDLDDIQKSLGKKCDYLSDKFDMISYKKNYSTLGSQKSAARTEDPKLWCHLQLRRYNRQGQNRMQKRRLRYGFFFLRSSVWPLMGIRIGHQEWWHILVNMPVPNPLIQGHSHVTIKIEEHAPSIIA